MPFILAVWVGRRIESRFGLHGALVGVVAALIYMGLAWGQPQPLLYKIAHGLKVVGGMAGGVVASRLERAADNPAIYRPRFSKTITPLSSCSVANLPNETAIRCDIVASDAGGIDPPTLDASSRFRRRGHSSVARFRHWSELQHPFVNDKFLSAH